MTDAQIVALVAGAAIGCVTTLAGFVAGYFIGLRK